MQCIKRVRIIRQWINFSVPAKESSKKSSKKSRSPTDTKTDGKKHKKKKKKHRQEEEKTSKRGKKKSEDDLEAFLASGEKYESLWKLLLSDYCPVSLPG